MKKLIALGYLLLPLLMAGQVLNNSQTAYASGTALVVPNLSGSTVAVFHEVVSGSPTSTTVLINGCTVGNTCTQLDTFTILGNGYTDRTVTTATSYHHYSIVPTWTGGSSVQVTIGTTIPKGATSSGGGAWGSITGTLSDQTDLNTVLTGKQSALGFTPLSSTNNLSDLSSTSTALTNLGVSNVGKTGSYSDLLNIPSLTVQTPGYSPNQTLTGCGVEYTSGLSFTVGTCQYTIAGVTFNTPLSNITLSAADATNPRIDVIGVNSSGAVFSVTGTPNSNPVQPTIDPSTQLQLTFVYVPASSSSPLNVTTDNIYEENTEWTSAVTTNINAASTSNPYRGTKDVEATASVLNNNIKFTKPSAGTVDLATRNNLIFYIRSKGAWPTGASGGTAARYLSIYWQNGTTQKGSQVILRDGQFGFSSSNTTSYQQISIPTALFGANGIPVTTLAFQVSGASGSSSIGWYLDGITLQGGQSAPALPSTLMNFRGTWSSAVAYNYNDLVVNSTGIGYTALLANTNVPLTTAGTWQPIAPNIATTASKNQVFAGPGTPGTLNIVQSASNTCAGGSCTATLTNNVTAGHLLVVTFTSFGFSTLTSTRSDTFTLANSVANGVNQEIFYSCNAVGGATAVTMAGGSRAVQIHVIEASGNPTSSCLDANNTTGLTNGSAVTSFSASLTTTQSNDLIIAAFGSNFSSCTSVTAGPESTSQQSTLSTGSPSGNWTLNTEAYNAAAGVGSVTQTATCNLGAIYWNGNIAAFKLATPVTTGASGYRTLLSSDLPTGTSQTIASGTATLGTSAITSATCASAVTVAAVGATTTDSIQADFSADPTSTTGYAPSAGGILTIIKYPTTGNVNFKVCNNTSGSITPGAVTLNWRVMR